MSLDEGVPDASDDADTSSVTDESVEVADSAAALAGSEETKAGNTDEKKQNKNDPTDRSLWWIFGVSFGSGLIALFTPCVFPRSEEHTSELQSRPHLVCRLLLEKKKKQH